jgi:hypothetical protein
MANTSVPKRAYLPEERSGVILLKSRCLIRLPQSLLAKRKSTLLDTNNSDLLGCGGKGMWFLLGSSVIAYVRYRFRDAPIFSNAV